MFVSQNMFVHQKKKPKRRRVLSKEDRVLLEFLKESAFPGGAVTEMEG